MIVEIINPMGKVSYTRPLYSFTKDGKLHPDVLEALNTPGYSIRNANQNVRPKSMGGLSALPSDDDEPEDEHIMNVEDCGRW